jgi:clan AA aspartic protease
VEPDRAKSTTSQWRHSCSRSWTAEVQIKRLKKEKTGMGTTHLNVLVRNPEERNRTWEGPFLVDSGAIDCLIPANRLAEIGMKPQGQRTYELADGTELKMDITIGQIEFMGEFVGATIIFGPDGAEPILGVTALESAGFELDPRSQRLKKLPSVRLK